MLAGLVVLWFATNVKFACVCTSTFIIRKWTVWIFLKRVQVQQSPVKSVNSDNFP